MLLINKSLIIGPLLILIDSPLTSGLSMEVNQLNIDGTFALRTAFAAEPEQISRVLGKVIVISGITVTAKLESGP